MSITTFENEYLKRTTKMSGWFALAIALHVVVVGVYIWVTHNQQWEELLPPPSVVMEISIESQAEQLTEVNIGQLQELSVASQAHEMPSEEKIIPPLAVNEQAEVQVAKAVSKQRTVEVKKQKREKQTVEQKQATDSKSNDAPVTSDAAAPRQTQKVAAEFNSQSQSIDNAKRLWEAQVLGKLNKYKRFPEEAVRRGRVGQSTVTFTVDPQGFLLASDLVNSSGTRSLDREALQVLSRAAPLPEPPAEILMNGRVTVRIPIDFTLNEK
ncbi:TPA: energy transducer TonB [Providencia rettgeri]|uniref:energy transducer TonB family protein n=1 Tax=Providencia huaxiensis TaxID=2027290 RepID=UPI0024AA2805|nr:energy transducer TonB [Providencia stuartii]HEC8322552.1 energy transducer TonB [Providencia rettgeri]